MPSITVSGSYGSGPVFRVSAVTTTGAGPATSSPPATCLPPPDPSGYVCRTDGGTYRCESCLSSQANGRTLYATLAECSAACIQPPPPDPAGWICRTTGGTYTCQFVVLGQANGQVVHSTEAACLAACVPPCTPDPVSAPTTGWYNCARGGSNGNYCEQMGGIKNPNFGYSTLQSCTSDCAISDSAAVWIATSIEGRSSEARWTAQAVLTDLTAAHDPDHAIDYVGVNAPPSDEVVGRIPSLPAGHGVVAVQRRTWSRGTINQPASCVAQKSITVEAPAGVSLPIQVTVYGQFDETFGINSQGPIDGCNAAQGIGHSTTFVLTQRCFTIEYYDTKGGACSGSALIAYSKPLNTAP